MVKFFIKMVTTMTVALLLMLSVNTICYADTKIGKFDDVQYVGDDYFIVRNEERYGVVKASDGSIVFNCVYENIEYQGYDWFLARWGEGINRTADSDFEFYGDNYALIKAGSTMILGDFMSSRHTRVVSEDRAFIIESAKLFGPGKVYLYDLTTGKKIKDMPDASEPYGEYDEFGHLRLLTVASIMEYYSNVIDKSGEIILDGKKNGLKSRHMLISSKTSDGYFAIGVAMEQKDYVTKIYDKNFKKVRTIDGYLAFFNDMDVFCIGDSMTGKCRLYTPGGKVIKHKKKDLVFTLLDDLGDGNRYLYESSDGMHYVIDKKGKVVRTNPRFLSDPAPGPEFPEEAQTADQKITGLCTIRPAENTSVCWDVAGNSKDAGAWVLLWNSNHSHNQIFNITKTGKQYRIQAMQSRLYLYGKGKNNLTQKKKDTKSKYQKFTLVKNDDNTYGIKNASGYYLTMAYSSTDPGTQLVFAPKEAGAAKQKFVIQ